MDSNFEWDEAKAERNSNKHKVSFEEAETVFLDPFYISAYDDEHSDEEDRYIAIGISIDGRLLTIIYTERGNNIRLISARRATAAERTLYESGNV